MKKKILAFLAGLTAIITASGCANVATSSFTGSYWLNDYTVKTAPDGFYEKIEYEISSVKSDDKSVIPTYAPSIYQAGKLDLIVDSSKSSYVTELYTENGNYVYETSTTINATYNYNYDSATKTFKDSYVVENDFIKTKTIFKDFNGKFAPIISEREASNVFPIYATPTKAEQFKKIGYKTVIEYGEKNATVTLIPADPISKEYLSSLKEPVTVKKYNKKAYIDNELIVLLFRSFKLDSSLSYTFSSIENVTGSLKQVIGKAKINNSTTSSDKTAQTSIIPMTIDACSLDCGKSRFSADFDALGVSFATTGEFAQTFITAYYETTLKGNSAGWNSKHIMIKSYQPAIYNCAYLVYTIHTVYNQKI